MPIDKSRKLYIHFRGGAEDHTQVLHTANAAVTIDDVCKQLVLALKTAKGILVDSSQLQVASARGRAFGRSQLVHKAFDSDADAYVTLEAAVRADREGNTQDGTALPGAPHDAQPCSNGRPGGGPEKAAQDSTMEHAQQAESQRQQKASPLIGPLLSQASQKEAAQHFRAAAFIYQQVHWCGHSWRETVIFTSAWKVDCCHGLAKGGYPRP